MNSGEEKFSHPHDTITSGALRFSVEIIAWVAGSWYVSSVSYWLVVPTLVILVGFPAIFSTINDKRHVVIPTRGSMRVLIELILTIVALVAPWFVWPSIYSSFTSVVVIISLLVGAPRFWWLLKGAPST